jgi:hypothetical protein
VEGQTEKVRKKNVERKRMKSGRNELQKERKGYKGDINYTAFSNYDAANELTAIRRLGRANATLR